MAKWLSSRAPLQAAQCFVSSNPGHEHGTAYQATLRQHPTCHNQKDPQLRICNYVPGGFGEKKKKSEIFKKKKQELFKVYHLHESIMEICFHSNSLSFVTCYPLILDACHVLYIFCLQNGTKMPAVRSLILSTELNAEHIQ